VPPVFRAACALAQTYGWTREKIQFHMTRIQPVRSRAIYCHQADNQTSYSSILERNCGGFQTHIGLLKKKRPICLKPKKQPKLLDRKRKCQNYTILSATKMGNNNKI